MRPTQVWAQADPREMEQLTVLAPVLYTLWLALRLHLKRLPRNFSSFSLSFDKREICEVAAEMPWMELFSDKVRPELQEPRRCLVHIFLFVCLFSL